MQWTDLIISKTRTVSILRQKMNNKMLNFSLVFETLLAIFLLYCPVFPQYLGIYPLNPDWWVPALPFSLLILLSDELRRLLLRKNNLTSSFFHRETYY